MPSLLPSNEQMSHSNHHDNNNNNNDEEELLSTPLLADDVQSQHSKSSSLPLLPPKSPQEVREHAHRLLSAAENAIQKMSLPRSLGSLSLDGSNHNRADGRKRRGNTTSSVWSRGVVLLKRKGIKIYYSFRGRFVGANDANDEEEPNQPIPTRNKSSTTQSSSLSTSPSTPQILKYILPPLLLLNHILFLTAQTRPMWNLTYNINIAVTATASTFKSKTAFDVLNLPHHYEYVQNNTNDNNVLETFTYWDAIDKLWKGDGLDDEAQLISKVSAVLLLFFSGVWPHLKLGGVGVCWFWRFRHSLIDNDGSDENNNISNNTISDNRSNKNKSTMCSGYHRHKSTTTRRSPILRTLSIFGKWSLADVLVVCILIAVLHLDWNVDLDAVRKGVEEKLGTILSFVQNKYPDEVDDCKQLLNYECAMGHALVIHYPACLACETLIKNAYYHPEWTVGEGKDILDGIVLEGGGYAQLRVVGMIGTYFFCGAVILSILISLVVDYVDEMDRCRVEEELVEIQRENETSSDSRLNLTNNNNNTNIPPANHSGLFPSQNVNSPLTTRSITSDFKDAYVPLGHPGPSPTTNSALLKYTIMVILSIGSVPLVGYAVSLPTMERLVYGGIPTLLHDVTGMEWVQEYSLTSLVATTGDAGGWDTFLMITFGIFVVVGPILRSIALLLHSIMGLPVALLGECIEQPRRRTSLRMFLYQLLSTFQKALRPFIDASGAFCAWEVLIVALLMIQAEMPSITDTIYEDDRCKEADPDHGTICIEVQFNARDEFLVVVVAWIVLVAASAFVMDRAVNDDDILLPRDMSNVRYEYGMIIPQRTRANVSSNQSWRGALTDNDEINSAINEHNLTSLLLQTDSAIDERQPLEEIVFV